MFNQRSRSPSPHPITISCTMHKCTRKYREQKKKNPRISSIRAGHPRRIGASRYVANGILALTNAQCAVYALFMHTHTHTSAAHANAQREQIHIIYYTETSNWTQLHPLDIWCIFENASEIFFPVVLRVGRCQQRVFSTLHTTHFDRARVVLAVAQPAKIIHFVWHADKRVRKAYCLAITRSAFWLCVQRTHTHHQNERL